MKVSIITINYNDASGLQKTLESVAIQTYTDFEQIIIDGGSSDGSKEIISEFANLPTLKDKFKWISEKDNGVYNAQNKGIARAKGEYCLFLNAGDYFVNNRVLEDVFANKLTAEIIYGNLIVMSGDKVIGKSRGKNNTTFLDIYSSIVKHQAAFIKRELFDKYGFYDESLRIVADWAFIFKAIGFNAVTLQYINVDIACFDNNGISNNNSDLCKKERQKVLDQYMPTIMQEDYLLLQKYRGIKNIDKSKIGWFVFRLLAKVFKS